jgi:Predicted transcriptional regulators
MEPSEFLDILGNENRRKILALLADRPYYVSEISTRLSVAPKAVIGHLSLLENSGLIESNTDDQRRKYYSISKSLRLEVSVSPYSYSVHVNNIKLEMPDDPVYSLSLSFDAPRAARKKHFKDMPTGPVIHLASSYDSNDFSNEGDQNGGFQSGGFTIEIIGPNHPFYGHVGLLKDGGKALLESENENGESFSKSGDDKINPFSKSDNDYEKSFSNSDDGNENTFSKNNPQSRLQSREGYFLSRIFQVRDDLENLWNEQQELSRLQEDLTVRQSRLMNSFVHCATQLSDDKVDLDILFRLLKNDMSAAELCYATGHAPSLVLPRLKTFENKNMVEKYLLGGDFFWRLKDGSDL